MAAATALDVAALGRAYGERVVLRDVSFALAPGATVAVFGANGAGKTTLLRILAGLLRPHAGRAAVLGAELPREAYRMRGRIGLLGHEPMLYRDLTVRENLRFHARLHGVDATRAVIDREAPGFAEAMRAEGARHTPMGILSRGISGISNHTLIVNFPGSPKAIGQSWPIVEPTLKHAAATLER